MSSSLARRLLTRPLARPLERLDDRTVPATLITLAADGAGPLDAPVDILATSDDGRYVLFQTKATNVVNGQLDPVGTMDLFWRDTVANRTELVSGQDARNIQTGVNLGGSRSKTLGVEASTPEVQLNAVISGNGQAVSFLSGANASRFNNQLDPVTDDGGVDCYKWTAGASAGGTIQLISQDKAGFANGSYSLVSSPALSADGQNAAFVSDLNVWAKIDDKYIVGEADGVIDTGNQGPNVFLVVGTDLARPVTYGRTGVNVLDPDDDSDDFWGMSSDVLVDPLGRYLSAAGYSFVVRRDSRHVSLSNNFFGFGGTDLSDVGTDVWRYTFAGVGLDPPDSPEFDILTSGQSTFLDPDTGVTVDSSFDTNALPYNDGRHYFGGAGLFGYGSSSAAIIARDRGDIGAFSYTTRSSIRRPNAAGVFVETPSTFQPVLGYTYDAAGDSDLFYSKFSGVGQQSDPFNRYTNFLITGAFGSATQSGNGLPDVGPSGFALTPDGTKISFATRATDVLSTVSDRNAARDVFQYTAAAGAAPATVVLVSASAENPGLTSLTGDSFNPVQTTDGQLVAFQSTGFDLTVDRVNNRRPDQNGVSDIFVRNTATNVTTQASLIPGNGAAGNGPSVSPVLGGTFQNGRVYFTSTATDLDNNIDLPAGTPAQGYSTGLPLLLPLQPRFTAFSGGGGRVTFGTTSTRLDGTLDTTLTVQPFGKSYVGELRVATGDYNGDGTLDVIVGAGPGGGPRVAVLDGNTGRTLRDFFAFEPRFQGGVYVALGDVTGDGKADIIVGAGEGGGPRVQILNAATNKILLDNFVYESQFRGGARVAAGDVTGDGRVDLVTGAGIGGGPRVTVFDGTALPTLSTYTNFFAFESSLRGGAYVSVGDYDADGKADIAAGAGPDGGPRVTVFDAANIVVFDPNRRTTFVDFFAFDPDSRNGARPVLKDIDGDFLSDLVVGTGNGFPLIRTFSGSVRGTAETSAQPLQTLNPFDTSISLAGAWVG